MIPEGCKVYVSKWAADSGYTPDNFKYKRLIDDEAPVAINYDGFINFLYILNESEYIEFSLTYGQTPIEVLLNESNIYISGFNKTFCYICHNNNGELIEQLFKLGCKFDFIND